MQAATHGGETMKRRMFKNRRSQRGSGRALLLALSVLLLGMQCSAAAETDALGPEAAALLALGLASDNGPRSGLNALTYSATSTVDLKGIAAPSHNQSLTFDGTYFYSAYVETSGADRAVVYAHDPQGNKIGSALIPGWEHVGGAIYYAGWNYAPVTQNNSSASGFVRFKWNAATSSMLIDDLSVSFPNIRLGMATAVINYAGSTPGNPLITAFRLYSYSSRQYYQCTILNRTTANASASCGSLRSPSHKFQFGDPARQASAPFYSNGEWRQVVTPLPAYGPVDSRDMRIFEANDETVQTGNNERDAWWFNGSYAPEGIWIHAGKIYVAGHQSGTLTSACGVSYPCVFAYGSEYRQRVKIYNM